MAQNYIPKANVNQTSLANVIWEEGRVGAKASHATV